MIFNENLGFPKENHVFPVFRRFRASWATARASGNSGNTNENQHIADIRRELHGNSLDFRKTLLFLGESNDFDTVLSMF